MKIVPFNKITPFKHYITKLDARHIYPFDICEIKNFTYHMSGDICYLQYTLRDHAEIVNDNKKITVHPGSLLYIPPMQVSTYSESDDYEYIRIEFLFSEIKTAENVIPFDFMQIIFEQTAPEIKNNMQTIVDKFPIISETEELCVTRDFFELLYSIINRLYPPDHADVNTNIKAVVKHIKINSFRRETVADYAKIAGLSEQYFRTLFKKEVGMSPIEFRNYHRIEYAKVLLCNSVYTNEYVSTSIGFDDPNYFTRLFKKLTGYTPQDYKHKFSTPHYFETHSRKQYKKEHPGEKI